MQTWGTDFGWQNPGNNPSMVLNKPLTPSLSGVEMRRLSGACWPQIYTPMPKWELSTHPEPLIEKEHSEDELLRLPNTLLWLLTLCRYRHNHLHIHIFIYCSHIRHTYTNWNMMRKNWCLGIFIVIFIGRVKRVDIENET